MINKTEKTTEEVFCKNVKYDFNKNSDSTILAYTKAIETVKDMWNEAKQEEIDEIQEMLDNGDIASEDEYDKEYEGEFNPEEYKEKINEVANKYACNLNNLPRNIVVEVPISDVNNEEVLISAIQEKYNIKVLGMENHDIANSKEKMGQKIFDGIAKTLKSNEYIKFLNLVSNMEKYSCNNLALVYMQNSNAQMVKGKADWWKNYHRPLQVGQYTNGIMIYAPVGGKLTTEKEIEKYLDRNEWRFKKGSDEYEKEKKRLEASLKKKGYCTTPNGYRPIYVYDISQTQNLDKDDLEDIINHNKPLSENMENYDNVVNVLKDIINIDIPKDNDLSEQENIYQSILAYSDNLLLNTPEKVKGIKSTEPLHGIMHEVESTVATYIICNHIGINCEEKTLLALTKFTDWGHNKVSTEDIKKYLELGINSMYQTSFDRGNALGRQLSEEFKKEYEKLEKNTEIDKKQSKINNEIEMN